MADSVAEIGKHVPLGEEAKSLLRDGLTWATLLDLLIAGRLYADAIRFLSHALPKREAVWWACRCARQEAGANPQPQVAAALLAAEKWAADPGEDNRRAALPAAEAAGLGTPAGCAALAAFCSGGSLGPPTVPTIPPGKYLTARGVAGAILLAGVRTEPEKAAEKYRQALVLGKAIGCGADRWPETRCPALKLTGTEGSVAV
jgi:hypothetical protein